MKLFILALLAFIPLNYSKAQLSFYYPAQYRGGLEKDQYHNGLLHGILFEILTSYHHPQTDHADIISKNCQSESCYKQKVLSYHEARTYLFGEIHLEENSQGHFVRDVYCRKKGPKFRSRALGALSLTLSFN